MKTFLFVIGVLISAAALAAGCHMFDDPNEDIPKDCPLNSGYPCPCEPDEGNCDDGSACVYWAGDTSEGFCSAECDGKNDKESCAHTLGYGAIGHCWLMIESTDEPDYCIVVCEADGYTGDCPPGLECLETADDFSACFPPSAGDNAGDDDDSVPDDDDDTDGECECSSDEFLCGDSDDILVCSDGCSWTSYTCDYVCAYSDMSWTGECGYDESSGHDVCWCE